MDLDLDAVRSVRTRLVEQHMPAGHQKQATVAREIEAAGLRQHLRAGEGGNLGCRQQ